MRPFAGRICRGAGGAGDEDDHYPGDFGGNLDCKALVTGSTLYLPIFHDGALFSVGDGHAAQGDGELGCTAIECPYEKISLTFDLVQGTFGSPVAKTPEGWVAFGYSESLTDAAYMALDNMVRLLMYLYGFERREALTAAECCGGYARDPDCERRARSHAVLPYGSVLR